MGSAASGQSVAWLGSSVLNGVVNAELTISGVAGDTDVLILSDQNDSSPNPNVGTLAAGQVTGFGFAAPMYYSDFDELQLFLSNQANQTDELFIESTHAGRVDVDAGGGDDLVRIASTMGITNILLGAGTDYGAV